MTVNRTTASPARRRRAKAGLGVGLGITLFAAQAAVAQGDAPAPDTGATGSATLPAITVSGERGNTLRARTASVAGLDDAPLRDTPASVNVVTRALIDDQQAKRLSDVVRNDASVVNDYAPVGYFEG
ncbi:TonB-dependent receptor plug domain-containing protein, partial [Burkholderia sp. BCC1988]|uniref:TonB-dependent receptor plug domain-containing protein n=1 Tax=Burkholderia sp. BCC1988 TaxID=2817443 RepID=UPI0039EF5198